MKGTYLLVMELTHDTSILIGKQGMIDFQKGYYTYVGSALNGLEQRILRHLRSSKKIHWHIDYFLQSATIVEIFYTEKIQREECTIARILASRLRSIPGFGCSDCSCESHLFYGSRDTARQIASSLGMESFLLPKLEVLQTK